MNILSYVYTNLLFRPLFNLLVFITNILPTHAVGLSIILVTLVVRLILLPSTVHQLKQAQKNQEKMKDVQTKIKDIQKQHKDDKSKQAEATMQAYREAGVNPAAGCLPLLIQLPILIALYRVFLVGLGSETYHNLYSFISSPANIQTIFLGIPLNEPSLLLGIIAGSAQFILMKLSGTAPNMQPSANEDTAQVMQSMQRNMMYFFPVMTVFIALQLPAALSLYWVASTGFAILQQIILKKAFKTDAHLPAV